MLINWFTVVAEAINFLILCWLLKRFLYQPILDAIDAREKGIAAQLAETAAKQAEAQKERDELQHKNESFDNERVTLLKKATDEAIAERQRLLETARKEAETLRVKRQEGLANEQRLVNQEIVRWTQEQVFAITRKTLTDLADTSLEEQMSEVFIQRLGSISTAEKDQLAVALKTSSQPLRVRSAFELPPARRTAIESLIKKTVATEIPIQFETVSSLVSGIELLANGQKVAWSITDYLTALEKSAGELFQSEDKSDPKPELQKEVH